MRKYSCVKELREVVHSKEVSHDWTWNMLIFRKISIYITYLVYKTKIHPTQITFFWIFLGVLGSLTLIGGTYWHGLIGMTIYQIALIIDLVDGELARARSFKDENAYMKGSFLDLAGHYTHRGLMMICMGLWAYHHFGNILYVYAGILAMLGILLDNLYKLKKYEVLAKHEKFNLMKDYYKSSVIRTKHGFKEVVFELFRPNNLSLIFWVGVFGIIHILLLVYAIILPLMAIKNFLGVWKSFNKSSS